MENDDWGLPLVQNTPARFEEAPVRTVSRPLAVSSNRSSNSGSNFHAAPDSMESGRTLEDAAAEILKFATAKARDILGETTIVSSFRDGLTIESSQHGRLVLEYGSYTGTADCTANSALSALLLHRLGDYIEERLGKLNWLKGAPLRWAVSNDVNASVPNAIVEMAGQLRTTWDMITTLVEQNGELHRVVAEMRDELAVAHARLNIVQFGDDADNNKGSTESIGAVSASKKRTAAEMEKDSLFDQPLPPVPEPPIVQSERWDDDLWNEGFYPSVRPHGAHAKASDDRDKKS